MKVSVFKKSEPTKREFFLQLRDEGSSVVLLLVNGEGEELDAGRILSINEEMKIEREGHIKDDLGLPLDEERRLRIAGEDD